MSELNQQPQPQKKRLRFRMIVHCFEEGNPDYPAVTHIFNDSTYEGLTELYARHASEDRFFDRAKKNGRVTQKVQNLTGTGWADYVPPPPPELTAAPAKKQPGKVFSMKKKRKR